MNPNNFFVKWGIIFLCVLILIPVLFSSLEFWEKETEAVQLPYSMVVNPHNRLLYNQENEVIRQFIRKHNSQISDLDIERIVNKLSKEPLKWTILGIMKIESHFVSTCFSTKTIKKRNGKKVKKTLAIGLMGVNVCNIDELRFNNIIKHKTDLFKIEENIDSGIYIYKQFLQKTKGNTTLALKFYFNGPGNVYKDPEREDYNEYVGEVYRIVGLSVSTLDANKLINESIAMK